LPNSESPEKRKKRLQKISNEDRAKHTKFLLEELDDAKQQLKADQDSLIVEDRTSSGYKHIKDDIKTDKEKIKELLSDIKELKDTKLKK
jgi:hypothetical protein